MRWEAFKSNSATVADVRKILIDIDVAQKNRPGSDAMILCSRFLLPAYMQAPKSPQDPKTWRGGTQACQLTVHNR